MPAAYKNIARVLRAHGSKGEVVVAPLRGLPLLLHAGMDVHVTPPALDRERRSRVLEVVEVPDGARVRLSCCATMDDAESIVGCTLLARLDDLDLGPLDAAFDELLGREVVDVRHGSLGVIQDVMETPASDVWVVDGSVHGEVLIPVVEAMVEEVPSSGPIAVHIPDGLIGL